MNSRAKCDRPCPFCKKNDLFYVTSEWGDEIAVACKNCHATGPPVSGVLNNPKARRRARTAWEATDD